MSVSREAGRQPAVPRAITPLMGALLRLPHEAVFARMLTHVNQAGMDVTATELRVFLFPGPNGKRPIDLAHQCNMTRQAMNYVLAGLARRGYIERRPAPMQAANRIHLTARGTKVMALCRTCVTGIEHEWEHHLGARRFNALRQTLHLLATYLDKLPG